MLLLVALLAHSVPTPTPPAVARVQQAIVPAVSCAQASSKRTIVGVMKAAIVDLRTCGAAASVDIVRASWVIGLDGRPTAITLDGIDATSTEGRCMTARLAAMQFVAPSTPVPVRFPIRLH